MLDLYPEKCIVKNYDMHKTLEFLGMQKILPIENMAKPILPIGDVKENESFL